MFLSLHERKIHNLFFCGFVTSVVFFILNSVLKGHKILGLLYHGEIEETLNKEMEICDDRHFLSFVVHL